MLDEYQEAGSGSLKRKVVLKGKQQDLGNDSVHLPASLSLSLGVCVCVCV